MRPLPAKPDLVQVWRFIRGDTSPQEFELWLVENAQMKSSFGHELYVDLISADYRKPRVVVEILKQLEAWARAVEPMRCECITVAATQHLVMWWSWKDIHKTLEKMADRGEQFWWLHVYRCSVCGEWWLAAFEEVHEIYFVRRLSEGEITALTEAGEWPDDYDQYDTLVRLIHAAGLNQDYTDPADHYTLFWMTKVLAKARPGIRISEIATLLHVPPSRVKQEAEFAVKNHGAVIEMDVS